MQRDLSGKKIPETILRWSSFFELEELDVNCMMLSKKFINSSLGRQVCDDLKRKDKGYNNTSVSD